MLRVFVALCLLLVPAAARAQIAGIQPNSFLSTQSTPTDLPYFAPTQAANPGFGGTALFIGGGGFNSTWSSGLQARYNTGLGFLNMLSITTGNYDTGVGFEVMEFMTTGEWNTAIGEASLIYKTSANGNTSVGWKANLGMPLPGMNNGTATGTGTGDDNSCFGFAACMNLDIGNYNTVTGADAYAGASPTGSYNNIYGIGAGYGLSTGNNNSFFGPYAGYAVTTGSYNTIVGNYAGTAAMSSTVVLANGAGTVKYTADAGATRIYAGDDDATKTLTAEFTPDLARFPAPVRLAEYDAASLPPPGAARTIFVSARGAPARLAYSNGDAWRWVSDDRPVGAAAIAEADPVRAELASLRAELAALKQDVSTCRAPVIPIALHASN